MKLGNKRNAWLVGAVAASTIALTTQLEGRSNKPYLDIVRVWTVCDGETNVPMRYYSNAECDAMTKKSLVKYGDGVLSCVTAPLSANQHAALTLFAYNVGVPTACKSSVVRKINNGDYVGGCNFLLEYSYAGGRYVQGLRNRRIAEQKLCLKDST